jgi:hypothetical protein
MTNYLHHPTDPTPEIEKKHDNSAKAQEQWVSDFWKKQPLDREISRDAMARAYDQAHGGKVRRGSIGRVQTNLSTGPKPQIFKTGNMVKNEEGDGWQSTYKQCEPRPALIDNLFPKSLFPDSIFERKPQMGEE